MIVNVVDLACRLARFLQEEIAPLPDAFFTSFEFTSTGKALTHPLVFGLLSRFAWGVEGVSFVGLDVAVNEGNGIKFEPDVVGYAGNFADEGGLKPVFFIDYESPN